ncbi:putative orfan [Tupanvirus soda lake]|uniref:Orfan n=2 Tax=Tupanvirus TaxID=2094720 RepID=A0AC62AD43_9VIRU|nr:putative orfan [Tupanvirus soda lake]QKU35702.1 putative orfan [Tupanvirus soda lake]
MEQDNTYQDEQCERVEPSYIFVTSNDTHQDEQCERVEPSYIFVTPDNTYNQVTLSEVEHVPYFKNAIHFSGGDQSIIKTSVTSFGIECIKFCGKHGFWPLRALDLDRTIVQGLLLEEVHDFLMIEPPNFYLDQIIDDLLWFVDNKINPTINITTSDHARITVKLDELDLDRVQSQDSGWENVELFELSQSFFEKEPTDFELSISITSAEFQFFLLEEEEIEYEETYCFDCKDGFCSKCNKSQNKCYCHRCKKCGDCNDSPCFCDYEAEAELERQEREAIYDCYSD